MSVEQRRYWYEKFTSNAFFFPFKIIACLHFSVSFVIHLHVHV